MRNLSDNQVKLYEDISRCQLCISLAHPEGVSAFAATGPKQTVPVSHFGDIFSARVWLVLNNPLGDRIDPNVNTKVSDYGVADRSLLTQASVIPIVDKYNSYFSSGAAVATIFGQWRSLLNGIQIGADPLTFEAGGICAVDLVKCPTAMRWSEYVRGKEAQDVIKNCLKPRKSGGKQFQKFCS